MSEENKIKDEFEDFHDIVKSDTSLPQNIGKIVKKL